MPQPPDTIRSPAERVGLVPVFVMLTVMWIEEIIDVFLDGRLDRYGIVPRQIDGLDGVVFSPFLHGDFRHLIANSLPFLILGSAIALGNADRFIRVTLLVGLIGGLGTWLTGPARSIHIGASGLVFGYLTYLMARGFFARKLSYLLVGILTFVVYGGVLWGVLPSPGISWQGHLFGAVGGVVAAWTFHQRSEAPSST